jgi:hypothetical protein
MTPSFAASEALRRETNRYLRPALGAGILLLVASIIGGIFSPNDFFRSYLMGYLFWFGLTLGSMAIVMMQYLTGGAWGVVSRRPLEAAMRTLPVIALLFIPICFGTHNLYEWADPHMVQTESVLEHRRIYMNTPFFIGRAVIYFAIWGIFAFFLNHWSIQEDRRGNQQRKLEALSAPGLIIYVFTLTFAAVDWAESLETHWFSTMWGFLFVVAQGIATIGFAIVIMAWLWKREPLENVLKPAHFHDLGKLLLMFVMLWAYFAFSQLLIVWAGNLSDEIPWYFHRLSNSWGWLGVLLIVLQFMVPFVLLLWRSLKRNPVLLSCVVGLLILMRFVDLMWIVMPGYYQRGFRLHWLNICVPLALGGIWIAAYLRQLPKLPLMPLRAPNLELALDHEEQPI